MPDGSFELRTPCYSPTSPQAFTWAAKDIGSCVVALFKNYKDHGDKILNKIFYGVTARVTHLKFAEIIQKGPLSPVGQITHVASL